MIGLGRRVPVFAYGEVVDMRKSFDTLAAIVREQLGRDVPVPGTYKTVESSPQGLRAVLIAPIAGFHNPDTNQAAAIDVALFVLIIGGFLGASPRRARSTRASVARCRR